MRTTIVKQSWHLRLSSKSRPRGSILAPHVQDRMQSSTSAWAVHICGDASLTTKAPFRFSVIVLASANAHERTRDGAIMYVRLVPACAQTPSNTALALTSVFGRPYGLPHTLAAHRNVGLAPNARR